MGEDILGVEIELTEPLITMIEGTDAALVEYGMRIDNGPWEPQMMLLDGVGGE